MGNVQTMKPTSGTTKVPVYYPKTPVPGKLQILWDVNHKAIYNRLSPYTDYNNTTLIPGFTKQPYQWVTPEDGNKGLPGLRRYETRAVPIGSGPRDVIRVSKFLGSGKGIGFLATQFLLQTGNPYNETRIYNPASPIIAAGMALSLGTMRPQRNFDTSAGLLGIASTLIGSSIPNAIFGTPKINPPSGTAAQGLSDGTYTPMQTVGGKGLIRAGTAERAKSHLDAAWQPPSKFKFSLGGLVKGLFQNFIPQTQPGISHRSDEGAYGLMIGGGALRFLSNNSKTPFYQRFVGGSFKEMRKDKQYPTDAGRWYVDQNGNLIWEKKRAYGQLLIGTGFRVAIDTKESTDTLKPGVRYGDAYGKDAKNVAEGDQASDVLWQWNEYRNRDFPTKGKSQVKNINDSLKKVLDDITKATDGIYSVAVPTDSQIIRNGDGKSIRSGYDLLMSIAPAQAGARREPKLNYGVLAEYKDRGVRVVDDTIKTGGQKSLSLPAAGKGDFINRLTVLDKQGSDMGNGKFSIRSRTLDKDGIRIFQSLGPDRDYWNPYEDDQIAFFFYDIVNEKYIPFRATIKGLSEASNASWDELPFIGRADKVYSYGGFTRNLSLGFKIVISSLSELAPTWQRINYLTTLVKPSNYTVSKFAGASNRFMVPPMVMLTVGDMYKEQPVLIQSCTTAIPDDATWETLNKENAPGGWEYLANYMKAPNMLYGQLPREVDITLTMVLLEKERAIAGGANFGHAPRDSEWKPIGTPNNLHKSLVVDNVDRSVVLPNGSYNPIPDAVKDMENVNNRNKGRTGFGNPTFNFNNQ